MPSAATRVRGIGVEVVRWALKLPTRPPRVGFRGLGRPRGTPLGRAKPAAGHPDDPAAVSGLAMSLAKRTRLSPSSPGSRLGRYGPHPGSGSTASHPPSSSNRRPPPPVCGCAGSPHSRPDASCDHQWPSAVTSVRHAKSPIALGCPARSPWCRSRGRPPACGTGNLVSGPRPRVPAPHLTRPCRWLG